MTEDGVDGDMLRRRCKLAGLLHRDRSALEILARLWHLRRALDNVAGRADLVSAGAAALAGLPFPAASAAADKRPRGRRNKQQRADAPAKRAKTAGAAAGAWGAVVAAPRLACAGMDDGEDIDEE